jgi:putative membrane protein
VRADVIEYDRTRWWRTCLAFGGTVLPHVLGRVGILTGFCLALTLLNEHVLRHHGYPLPALDPMGHNVLGITVSLLIVFRTNSSYARFWEGRTLWGALVNGSRSLVRLGAAHAGPADDLARLVTAYVIAIKQYLRDDRDLSAIRPLISGVLYDEAAAARNPPSVLARALSEWIRQRREAGRLDAQMAVMLERVLMDLVNAQGGCERIHITPLPFIYVGLIKELVLVYLVTLPFVLVDRMGFAAPVTVAVVSLAMFGIEDAGVEIEDPFGCGPNHLPLDTICANLARDTAQIAGTRPG